MFCVKIAIPRIFPYPDVFNPDAVSHFNMSHMLIIINESCYVYFSHDRARLSLFLHTVCNGLTAIWQFALICCSLNLNQFALFRFG